MRRDHGHNSGIATVRGGWSTVDERVYSSVTDLTSVELEEDDVELPGGRLVRVRELSRAEVLRIRKENGDDALKIERATLVAAMVNPRMTPDEVAAWQRKSGVNKDIGKVQQRIQELSGMFEGADKSNVVSHGDDGPGVRALPSAEAQPNGS